MFQSIFELIRHYWDIVSNIKFVSGDKEKTHLPIEINVFNIIAMCFISLLVTNIFSISCIISIRRRGEIVSLHGILLLTIAGSSLVLLVATARSSVNYFRFNDQDDVLNLMFHFFLATNLLGGLILLRAQFNME